MTYNIVHNRNEQRLQPRPEPLKKFRKVLRQLCGRSEPRPKVQILDHPLTQTPHLNPVPDPRAFHRYGGLLSGLPRVLIENPHDLRPQSNLKVHPIKKQRSVGRINQNPPPPVTPQHHPPVPFLL